MNCKLWRRDEAVANTPPAGKSYGTRGWSNGDFRIGKVQRINVKRDQQDNLQSEGTCRGFGQCRKLAANLVLAVSEGCDNADILLNGPSEARPRC